MIEYNFYLVAFIDILGQKESFKEQGKYIDLNLKSLSDDLFQEKLINAHKETAVTIENLRKGFKGFFDAYTANEEPKVSIPKEKIEQFKKMRQAEIDLQVFSDCILASCVLKPSGEYYSNIINSVHGVLMACCAMLFTSLSVRKPFRAGIEIGLATKMSNNEIYGPALFRAYELESRTAQYPRVVVGDELINFLVNLSKKHPQLKNQTKEDLEWCKLIADNCLKMIVVDIDGISILDYLGQESIHAVKDGLDEDIIKRGYANALKFIEEEYKKWKDIKDQKMAQRYDALRRYYRAHPQN